jgi:hypothetical protein
MIGRAAIRTRATLAGGHRGALPEASGKNDPARPEVLDGDLAGVFLVHRRQVVEGHAVELHLEELLHGQLAARIGEADHHAIDLPLPDNRRNVVDHANHAGIEHGRPDPRRIRIDEPDNVNAHLVPPLVKLPRQLDRRRAGANDEQPLAWPHPATGPLEEQPPPDGDHDHD